MTTTRFGLIGAGGVATRHAKVLSALPGVQVSGITDVAAEAAGRLAAEHGARVYDTVADLIDSGPDAIYVCVPPFAHGDAERAVIAAGLPMFVEKPIAINHGIAAEIASLVESRGLLTAVGHHWRYLPVVEKAREVLAGRPIRLVTGSWLDKVPPVAWWPIGGRSGGPVVEQAAHVLDLARYLAGEVDEVTAYGNGTPPAVEGADVDGATTAVLRFAGGAVGNLAATCVLGWKHRAGLEIYADGLALALTESELVIRDGDHTETVTCEPTSAHVAVDRAFVSAVRGEQDDVRVPYAEALRTHELALAVAQSAAEGRTVRPGAVRV
ncbi:Gfo/Idh/MocA family oxidoreductase [Actinoplanes sp. NEAU-A12]|uniref:Gfo/Idh/MocA family oxidoreductase n=1 Tax=Actinoplanes sandaracinus TaxID=3045177 RepID=A0ABT6WKB9_9ACTN|nr:Gfo/Idh/MocA family oxidoreductase [Actinoplanes sandaracinus]MDI6100185.1 Gfo/Idh/MocA family oxidoreductase [Actinoplanes sandaracinus]